MMQIEDKIELVLKVRLNINNENKIKNKTISVWSFN